MRAENAKNTATAIELLKAAEAQLRIGAKAYRNARHLFERARATQD